MSTSDRREALRARLVELARAHMASGGISAVKARPLAAEAGCSVGAIYNVFGDLTDLILAVNGETFIALGTEVQKAVAPDEAPVEQLIRMSEAYLDFARANPRLWRALFETDVRAGVETTPDWYVMALDRLLTHIDAPLAELYPGVPPLEVRERTRALFSAIHGIVLLGVEGRASAVGTERLHEMIRFVLVSVATSRQFVNDVQ